LAAFELDEPQALRRTITVTGQSPEDNGIDAQAVLEQGLMFAITCGEVEGLTMPVRVRTFEDAGIRTPKHGLVVKDADGREFRLAILGSSEAAAEPKKSAPSNLFPVLPGIAFRLFGGKGAFAPPLVGPLLPQAGGLIKALTGALTPSPRPSEGQGRTVDRSSSDG
jgi:hypothetical protein